MQLAFPIRGDKLSMSAQVREHIARHQSAYQTIDVFDTEAFGKALLLDGHIQLTELDEHAYHEALVQIPLLSLTDPQRALVIGGGDGGVARELAKHPSIQGIEVVEIDRAVVEVCRAHLPGLSAGAFEDPRVTLHLQDAFPFLREARSSYDLIVMDSTDVYEGEDGNLSERLFTDAFYRDCLRCLSDDGFLVTQADNPIFCPYSLRGILGTLSEIFPRSGHYQALVPSFGGMSAFAWGSKGANLSRWWVEPEMPLRYLNEATYRLAFASLQF